MVLHDDMTDRTSSLADCMTRASEDGYTDSFEVRNDKLVTDNEKNSYDAEDVSIDHRYIFEGKTVEADESLVYLIETRDGRRGTLIDAYGPYADTKLAAFIRSVEKIKDESETKERRSWKEFLRGY